MVKPGSESSITAPSVRGTLRRNAKDSEETAPALGTPKVATASVNQMQSVTIVDPIERVVPAGHSVHCVEPVVEE
jgi:hypothetical protein